LQTEFIPNGRPFSEEGLRTASKKIDVMMKQFEENYAVRDKQDVLAMCALQFASQAEQKQIDNISMVRKPSKEKNQCAFRSISRQLNVLYRN
jgi:cell division protein ZapA (FtsZ GTPase activity inhibitor)